MVISQKQARTADIIRGRESDQIFMIGALGTGKTLSAAVAMLSVGLTYPGSLIVVARKNLTELKRGTLLSFHEASVSSLKLVTSKERAAWGSIALISSLASICLLSALKELASQPANSSGKAMKNM